MDELPGWKYPARPQVYAGDQLYDLIDGGADIYFEYGFPRLYPFIIPTSHKISPRSRFMK